MDLNQAQKLIHINNTVIALQIQLGTFIQYLVRIWDDQDFKL